MFIDPSNENPKLLLWAKEQPFRSYQSFGADFRPGPPIDISPLTQVFSETTLANDAYEALKPRKQVWGRWLRDLGKGDLFRLAFFLLDIASYFQQSVEHFGAFRAAHRKLRICLLVGLFHPV